MKELIEKYWQLVLAIILFFLGSFYSSRAYGYEPIFEHPLAKEHIQLHLNDCDLDYDDCKSNAQKVQFHKENGDRCYNDAKNRCWYLPNITDRDKARYCWTNAGVLASPGEPRSKLIIALVTTLIQYGIDCSDEWHEINNKLYWSQYHYEMMEFHEDLIRHGYP